MKNRSGYFSLKALSLCGPCVSEWPRRVTVRAPKKVFARTVEKNKKIEKLKMSARHALMPSRKRRQRKEPPPPPQNLTQKQPKRENGYNLGEYKPR